MLGRNQPSLLQVSPGLPRALGPLSYQRVLLGWDCTSYHTLSHQSSFRLRILSVSFPDAGTWWSAGKEKGLSKCLMNEQIPSGTIQEGGAQESGLRLGLFPVQGSCFGVESYSRKDNHNGPKNPQCHIASLCHLGNPLNLKHDRHPSLLG